MDPEKAADFDDSLDTLAKIRSMPTVVEKADAVVLECMPLVEAVLAEGFAVAESEIPGGPLVALAIHTLEPVIESRIRAWVQARAASFKTATPPAPPAP